MITVLGCVTPWCVLGKYVVSEGPAASVFKVNLNMYASGTLQTLMTAGPYGIMPCFRRLKTVSLRSGLAICYNPSVLAYLCLCLFEWLSTLKLCAGISLCSDRIRAG